MDLRYWSPPLDSSAWYLIVRVNAERDFPTFTKELYCSLWNRGCARIAIRFSLNAGNCYHIAVVDVLIFGTSGETSRIRCLEASADNL
jgi:hypothetical protein